MIGNRRMAFESRRSTIPSHTDVGAGRLFEGLFSHPFFKVLGAAEPVECRDDPEAFVDALGRETEDEREARIALAKAICADCPIRLACFAYAVETKQMGVWGGTTSRERKNEVRRTRRIKEGTE